MVPKVPADAGEPGGRDAGMETPLSPVPDPAADAPAKAPRKSRLRRGKRRKERAPKPAAGGRGPIGTGWAYAGRISLRVLVFVVLVQLLLGLTVVLPFAYGVGKQLEHNPHAAALAGQPTAEDRALGWEAGLDPGIWADTKRELSELFEGLTYVHFWVALVAWLFGAVAAGGFLGTYVAGEDPVRVGAFISQGGKYFGRMLRVGLLFAVAYYLAARLVLEAWGGSVSSTEFEASAETAGWWGDRVRELVMVLCFFWFRMAGDLARADLVVFGRKSAFGAWIRGLAGALRPRMMLVALAFGGPSFLVLLGLGFLAQSLTGDGVATLIVLFLVYQLAVAVRWAGRAGVLAAFAHTKQ